jgi:hypothetical protein
MFNQIYSEYQYLLFRIEGKWDIGQEWKWLSFVLVSWSLYIYLHGEEAPRKNMLIRTCNNSYPQSFFYIYLHGEEAPRKNMLIRTCNNSYPQSFLIRSHGNVL